MARHISVLLSMGDDDLNCVSSNLNLFFGRRAAKVSARGTIEIMMSLKFYLTFVLIASVTCQTKRTKLKTKCSEKNQICCQGFPGCDERECCKGYYCKPVGEVGTGHFGFCEVDCLTLGSTCLGPGECCEGLYCNLEAGGKGKGQCSQTPALTKSRKTYLNTSYILYYS